MALNPLMVLNKVLQHSQFTKILLSIGAQMKIREAAVEGS